eukprot:1822830-Amphidinium_carterae.1
MATMKHSASKSFKLVQAMCVHVFLLEGCKGVSVCRTLSTLILTAGRDTKFERSMVAGRPQSNPKMLNE